MPTQIKEYQKSIQKKATASSNSDEKKVYVRKKNEQISHQNEHRNYCSLSVPVILSSKKKEKKRRSYVLPEHIIISTLKTIPQKSKTESKHQHNNMSALVLLLSM